MWRLRSSSAHHLAGVDRSLVRRGLAGGAGVFAAAGVLGAPGVLGGRPGPCIPNRSLSGCVGKELSQAYVDFDSAAQICSYWAAAACNRSCVPTSWATVKEQTTHFRRTQRNSNCIEQQILCWWSFLLTTASIRVHASWVTDAGCCNCLRTRFMTASTTGVATSFAIAATSFLTLFTDTGVLGSFSCNISEDLLSCKLRNRVMQNN